VFPRVINYVFPPISDQGIPWCDYSDIGPFIIRKFCIVQRLPEITCLLVPYNHMLRCYTMNGDLTKSCSVPIPRYCRIRVPYPRWQERARWLCNFLL
jgi:hypothetical protein